jgi:hypothetical protein
MQHGHMSRCTVTCHDARSHVTMHGHMNVKFLWRQFTSTHDVTFQKKWILGNTAVGDLRSHVLYPVVQESLIAVYPEPHESNKISHTVSL